MSAQTVTYTLATTPPSCPTCCDGSFTLTMAGCTSYTFTAIPFIGPPNVSANTVIYSNVCNGSYMIYIQGASPCTTPAQCIIGMSTFINSFSSDKNEFFVFPNPANNILFITSKTIEDAEIEITDLFGKTVLKSIYDTRINISHLNQGVYFLKIFYEGEKNFYFRFLKQ